MSSIEPRLNPGNGAPAAKGSNGNGSKSNGSVAVANSVESALAAVQQQLAREAATITATVPVVTAPPPAPVVAPPPPPPPAPKPAPLPPPPPSRQRAARPAPVPVVLPDADDDDYDDLDDYDEDFWGEPAPPKVRVDTSMLTRQERRKLGKLRARKVRRIVRHVSPWSVFKTSLLFYLCVWLILMVAGVLLWRVARDTGVISNAEKFYAKASGEKVFEIDGRRVFRAAAAAGAIFVLSATALTVLFSLLFNLITDLTGGVRITVLELESTRRQLRRGASKAQLKEKAGRVVEDDDDELAAIIAKTKRPPADADEDDTVETRAPRAGAKVGSHAGEATN